MRYSREIRLRVIGDYSRAQSYIPRARTLLGALWSRDREIGELYQSHMERTYEDGVHIEVGFIADQPYVTIDVSREPPRAQEPQPALLLTTWRPRGLLLTPKTVDHPDGWGLPRRDPLTAELPDPPTLGTSGGALPQVLLNRDPNNRHFDNPRYMVGRVPPALEAIAPEFENFLLRPTYDTEFNTLGVMHVAWVQHPGPASYADPQVPGDYFDITGAPVVPGVYAGSFNAALGIYQLGPLIVAQAELDEVTTPEWHTHRAEELLYYSATQEALFLRTNEVRVAAGEDRVFRALRGDADAALLGAVTIGTSPAASFAHSNPAFPAGYRTAAGRLINATGFALAADQSDNLSENLLTYSATSDMAPMGSPELGVEVAQLWIDSPYHYANMVNELWTAATFPEHSWAPPGTRGAAMYAQFYVPADFTNYWVESDGTSWSTQPVSAEDMVVWSQVFAARESWLPAYDAVVEHDRGLIGLFCGTNPLNREFAAGATRFGLGRSIYDLPLHIVQPRDRPADFLCIAGAAPFDRDGVPWLRVVYWESSEQLDEEFWPPPGEEYLTLRVVLIPEGLCESGNLPWRYALPPVWEPEFSHTFEHINGYLMYPENYIHFDPQGEDFVFEVERIFEQWATTVVPYASGVAFNGFGAANRISMAYPAAAVEREAYRYNAMLKTLVPLLPEQQPIAVNVSATTTPDLDDGGRPIHRYERSAAGSYQIWPHFDEFGTVQFVTLSINEYQLQRGNDVKGFEGVAVNAGAPYEDLIYDNSGEGRPWYGWRIRKLTFPGGKEFTYMQQYVWQYRSVEFDPDNRLAVFNVFPGTGENFYAVIHHIDIPTASLIYSKHGSVMTRLPEEFDPPFQDPDSWYLTGDSTYYLDAQLGGERVVEQIAHYPKPTPAALRPYITDAGRWSQSVMHDYPVAVYNTSFGGTYRTAVRINDPGDLYDFHLTPMALRYQTIITGPSGTEPGTFKFVQMQTVGKSAPLPRNGFLTGAVGTPDACYYNHIPVVDYKVSCYSGYDYIGETSTSLKWVARARAGRTAYCGFWHNVAPLFSKSEVEAKWAEFDGRWVVRLRIKHLNIAGWAPPDPWQIQFPLSTPNSEIWQPLSSWTFREPSDKVTSWTGRDDLTGSVVYLLSNFDIDESVGIEDVYDIEPFGRV